MDVRLAVYNMEWMKDLFHRDGRPKAEDDDLKNDRADAQRSCHLANVVRQMDPDILCIAEGPDTNASQEVNAAKQLEAWRDHHGLSTDYKAITGFRSRGQQELCALYKKSSVRCEHFSGNGHPFNKPFLFDTTNDLIKERYEHYRPPFEISVKSRDGSDELMRIIVAHTKSKGIFEAVDLARFEQLSKRNRRKLYAECYSIRERCDQWLETNPNLKVAVVGDINDGFGLDYYEQRFSRSAVEILLGDVWAPEKILRHVLQRPKRDRYGWNPWTSRYQDRLTENRINVMIDHILVSRAVKHQNALIWNPRLSAAPKIVTSITQALTEGSDHFPLSVDIEL